MSYHYLQCAMALVAVSELTALTSLLDQAACQGGYRTKAKTPQNSFKCILRPTSAIYAKMNIKN